MIMFRTAQIMLISCMFILFSACDSSSYATDENDTTVANSLINSDNSEDQNNKNIKFSSVSGVVVDGYISGASVCLDLNFNGICENSEPVTTTDADGEFSFEKIDFGDNSTIPIIATGGIDISTEKPLLGELKNIAELSKDGSNSSIVVSPLTDLVANTFLNLHKRDALALSDAKSIVLSALGVSNSTLELDPMKNRAIFVKSQELQHTKRLIQTAIERSGVSFSASQNKIKKELVEQNMNIQRVLVAIDIDDAYNIPENKRAFIIEQVGKVKNSLTLLSDEMSLDIENLNRFQKSLDLIQDEANSLLAGANESVSLEALDINISTESITKTNFNSSGAILDDQACRATHGYSELKSNGFFTNKVDDYTNGLSIKSEYYYDSTANLADSEVKLFYPDLTEAKRGENIVVFQDNYFFVFDLAWVSNANRVIYIMTPEEENGLNSCYRFELDSEVANSIKSTKVYSYSDI